MQRHRRSRQAQGQTEGVLCPYPTGRAGRGSPNKPMRRGKISWRLRRIFLQFAQFWPTVDSYHDKIAIALVSVVSNLSHYFTCVIRITTSLTLRPYSLLLWPWQTDMMEQLSGLMKYSCDNLTSQHSLWALWQNMREPEYRKSPTYYHVSYKHHLQQQLSGLDVFPASSYYWIFAT